MTFQLQEKYLSATAAMYEEGEGADVREVVTLPPRGCSSDQAAPTGAGATGADAGPAFSLRIAFHCPIAHKNRLPAVAHLYCD